jgi:hypothetical protein
MTSSTSSEEVSTSNEPPATFPRRIGVVFAPVDDLSSPALRYLLLHLNQLQRWFQFEIYPAEDDILLDTLSSTRILEREPLRAELEQLWVRYCAVWLALNKDHKLKEGPPDYLVLVTLARFEDEYYSMRKGNVSVLGLGNWRGSMAPPSILEFMITFVLREAVASVSKKLRGSVHLGTKGCLFDFTPYLEDARQKVLNGFICAHCEECLRVERLGNLCTALVPILQQKWIGSMDDPSSPASITAALGFDLFRTKGLKPTFWQRITTQLEQEGVVQLVKIVGGVVLAVLLVWLGLKE